MGYQMVTCLMTSLTPKGQTRELVIPICLERNISKTAGGVSNDR